MSRPDTPSSSSMPFLARLSPAAREAAPSVRAALPSRLAAGEALEPLTDQAVVSGTLRPQAASMPHGGPADLAPSMPGPQSGVAASAAAGQREPAMPAHRPALEAAPPTAPLLADRSRPALDVRPPLRESAVAQRAVLPQAEKPAVVHVTIDRVDVRAPSPAVERRSSPRKRSASTVSLDDYLRQRERPRGGSR